MTGREIDDQLDAQGLCDVHHDQLAAGCDTCDVLALAIVESCTTTPPGGGGLKSPRWWDHEDRQSMFSLPGSAARHETGGA